MSNVLFIFRRDLRLIDNKGLYYATKLAHTNKSKCFFIFIYNMEQIDTVYTSTKSLMFMYESLLYLETQLKQLSFYKVTNYSKYAKLILKICKNNDCNTVVYNKDYTTYAIKRDNEISNLLNENNITLNIYDDALLFAPEKLVKDSGLGYKKFTPFYLNAKRFKVDEPINSQKYLIKSIIGKINNTNIKNATVKTTFCTNVHFVDKYLNGKEDINKNIKGGTKQAEILLKKCLKTNYNANRNIVLVENNHVELSTSLLSAHLRFGTISPRYIYYIISNSKNKRKLNKLLQQLYWRDFYYSLVYFYSNDKETIKREKLTYIKSRGKKIYWCPYNYDISFNDNVNRMKKIDRENYEKWKHGKCQDESLSVKIVNQAMIQLNETGYINNRQRMIVASYLIFYLHIHWKFGEVYFSQKLIDHDYAINLGNWKWVASIETYSNNPNHIFSMESQEKRFYVYK